MSKVHQDLEILPLVDEVHASLYGFQGFEASGNLPIFKTVMLPHQNGGQSVADVKFARQVELEFLTVGGETDAVGAKLDVVSLQVALLETVTFHRGDFARKIFTIGVVGIDDTKFGFFEKLDFSGAVVFKSAVVIEVFMGEVSKDCGVDGDSQNAVLGQSVRGHFEHQKLGATSGNFSDALVKSSGINCGHVFNLVF